jgi:hypothetical protein
MRQLEEEGIWVIEFQVQPHPLKEVLTMLAWRWS